MEQLVSTAVTDNKKAASRGGLRATNISTAIEITLDGSSYFNKH